jgi:hypothetical protein
MSNTDERVILRRPAVAEDKDLKHGWVDEPDLKRQLGYKSSQTISNFRGQGMPSLKLGAKRYFDVAQVRAWILSRQPDMQPRRPGRPRRDSR